MININELFVILVQNFENLNVRKSKEEDFFSYIITTSKNENRFFIEVISDNDIIMPTEILLTVGRSNQTIFCESFNNLVGLSDKINKILEN